MPRPRLEVCPSPTGRNAERLFLLKLPRGADVKGALDSVNRTMRRHGRDADLGEHDGLRGKLEALLQHHIDEDRVGRHSKTSPKYSVIAKCTATDTKPTTRLSIRRSPRCGLS